MACTFSTRRIFPWRRGPTRPGTRINHRNPERRILVNEQLAGIPGQVLVFVRYWPQHIFQDEWVYNEADIDRARVVWARDLGDAENQKLRQYYPGRSVWLLEPDARPPKLEPYQEVKPEVGGPGACQPRRHPVPPKNEKPTQPTLKFEAVPRLTRRLQAEAS